MTTLSKVELIKRRYAQLDSKKKPWLHHFQLLGEYIHLRKQQFTQTLPSGGFLTDEIYDSTAVRANKTMASALVGALWPSARKAIRISKPKDMQENKDVKEYYEKVTDVIVAAMDHPRGGLPTAINEYMLDMGAFGTSGIGVFENTNSEAENPIRYEPWDIKGMLLEESPDGFVDTIYYKKPLTVFEAVKEYGANNLSLETQEKYANNNLDTKVDILVCIYPRMERNKNLKGVLDMPVGSIHMEFKSGHIIKESGFEEMPVKVSRFSKIIGEVFGYSPGMSVLADILELNAVVEATRVAVEKTLDPPLAVLDDGKLGGGVINTSAGALNVFKVTGRIDSGSPISPLFTVGDLGPVVDLIARLEKNISDGFFIDKLLDFNNQTKMTAFETNLRDQLRGQALGSIFIRQEAELLTPLVTRTFNILLKRGALGVRAGSKEEQELLIAGRTPLIIPEVVLRAIDQGDEVYDIQYISPAKRISMAEEVQGISSTFTFAAESAQIAPDAIDNVDIDKAIRLLAERTGTPTEVLNDLESVQEARMARQQQQQQMMAQQAQKDASEVARNTSQAVATLGASA